MDGIKLLSNERQTERRERAQQQQQNGKSKQRTTVHIRVHRFLENFTMSLRIESVSTSKR